MYRLKLAYIIFTGVIFSSFVLISAALVRHKRLISGEPTTIEKFPYVVSLEYSCDLCGLFEVSINVCGGSILTPFHVLTAAHCVDLESNFIKFKVRAGSSFKKSGGTVHEVTDYSIHENYTKLTPDSGYDLAVLRLSEPIDTSAPIQMFDLGEKCEPRSTATILGWGSLSEKLLGPYPRQLQSIEMTMYDRDECNNPRWQERAHPGEICARHMYGSVGFGDSGGPLVVDGRLAGIVSRGDNFYADVFTEVAYFRPWIDEQLAR